jgi:hypothetical protein
MTEVKTRTYELEGRLLEVCDCEVLCPCWIGEDPDGRSCESLNAWVVDKGTVEGVDVSSHIVATINHIPATSWPATGDRSSSWKTRPRRSNRKHS